MKMDKKAFSFTGCAPGTWTLLGAPPQTLAAGGGAPRAPL